MLSLMRMLSRRKVNYEWRVIVKIKGTVDARTLYFMFLNRPPTA